MEAKNEYLLLFRGKEWWSSVSAEELQKAMGQVKAWFEQLTESGKLKAAQPLERAGAIVSRKTRHVLADGPYAESKEVIGGYVLLQVNNLDQAIAVAQSCPTLQFGMEVEVRPVAEDCPMMAHARQAQAEEPLATA